MNPPDLSSQSPNRPLPKSNIAVYTNPAHDLKVVNTDIPEPKEGEVIVHVKVTGICGRYHFHLEPFVVTFISGNMAESVRQ
jgi:L-iditol 2-dehydrogenase